MNPRIDSENSSHRLASVMIALGMFGLIAPLLTFFLAVSNLPDPVKFSVLALLAIGYAVVCFWSFRKARLEASGGSLPVPSPDLDLDDRLAAMGEASEFFGASLKPGDLFRLVSSRVSEFFPFTVSALFVLSDSPDDLEIVHVHGPNAGAFEGIQVPLDQGLAGMAWLSGEVEMDSDLALDRRSMPPLVLAGLKSACAIPLVHEGKTFGVLTLYTDRRIAADTETQQILEAIGRRIGPLFLSSLSFERSLSNALTDTLTNLPNERAFYMVLENQLAESHRHRNDRPLTVLSIDIKNFAEANQSFGFATGDRMLAFTAKILASQLRKMDFLSRASNDEFLIILPTASEKFAAEIIQRIRDRFAAEPLSISDTDDLKIWLNFGWATFWQDGDTAEQLLQNARIRKQQSKAEEPSKVLWFPKEYVN
jgi:diguanylate cyclase (GGDEF)-like protein